MMKKYEESFSDNSIWITQTPTLATALLPFLVTESGHFYAESDYAVHRDVHDSFLLLYTLKGTGKIQSCDTSILLHANNAVIIDCHNFHSYSSLSDEWEFLWMHIKGSGVDALYNLIYPEHICPVDMSHSKEFLRLEEFVARNFQADILNSAEVSLKIHGLLNALLKCRLDNEQEKIGGGYSDFINRAIARMEENFSSPLTLDDIISDIPLSKYHFIRIFKQITGVTPYHYLTNYRINTAKILLRSEDISVGEVSERCGFSDTSNFINKFKKHTGQKPLEYKRYFMQ